MNCQEKTSGAQKGEEESLRIIWEYLKLDANLSPFKNITVFVRALLARKGCLFHLNLINIPPEISIFTRRAPQTASSKFCGILAAVCKNMICIPQEIEKQRSQGICAVIRFMIPPQGEAQALYRQRNHIASFTFIQLQSVFFDTSSYTQQGEYVSCPCSVYLKLHHQDSNPCLVRFIHIYVEGKNFTPSCSSKVLCREIANFNKT